MDQIIDLTAEDDAPETEQSMPEQSTPVRAARVVDAPAGALDLAGLAREREARRRASRDAAAAPKRPRTEAPDAKPRSVAPDAKRPRTEAPGPASLRPDPYSRSGVPHAERVRATLPVPDFQGTARILRRENVGYYRHLPPELVVEGEREGELVLSRCGLTPRTGRGGAAAATWKFRPAHA